MMHKGFLYATQLEDSNLYASVGVIDIENGNEVKMYEEKDHRMAGHLHFLDDLMFLQAYQWIKKITLIQIWVK